MHPIKERSRWNKKLEEFFPKTIRSKSRNRIGKNNRKKKNAVSETKRMERQS